MNTDTLRANFESWAGGYFAEGLNAEWYPIDKRYDDNIVQYAWDSYQDAHNAQLAKINKLEEELDECKSELMNYALSEDSP